VLGGSASCGEARARGLHGGGAMTDGRKGGKACGCAGGFFYRQRGLEEGPRLPGNR
jgi:hypothetical protein